MPHLSKNKPSEKVISKIKKNLFSVLTKKHQNKSILDEVFTETEYLMLAKRLAVIILLFKGVSTYKISRNLKVSNSTILRFQQNILLGRYQNIKKLVESKSDNKKVLDMLEKIILVGMRPYAGEGRTSWLKDLFDKK